MTATSDIEGSGVGELEDGLPAFEKAEGGEPGPEEAEGADKKAEDGVIVSLGLQMKAVYRRIVGNVEFVAEADAKAGSIVRVPDGRAGIFLSDVTRGHICVATVAGVVTVGVPDESVYSPGDRVFWDVESQLPAGSGLGVGVVIEAPVPGKKQVLVELNLRM